jgi:hypothetical protein
MPSPIIGRPVPDEVWEAVRTEFALPTLEQVRCRLAELMEDPAPVMRQLVRVFIDEGTYCRGFQFLPDGQLHETVTSLFRHAMELKIPQNYFTAWMTTSSAGPGGARPVDSLPPRTAAAPSFGGLRCATSGNPESQLG